MGRPRSRPTRRVRIDIEQYGLQWLATGKPAAMEFIGWKDSWGRRIGTAEEVWRAYGEALLAEDPEACAYALQFFGPPTKRRRPPVRRRASR
jgi:hypothetical protein